MKNLVRVIKTDSVVHDLGNLWGSRFQVAGGKLRYSEMRHEALPESFVCFFPMPGNPWPRPGDIVRLSQIYKNGSTIAFKLKIMRSLKNKKTVVK